MIPTAPDALALDALLLLVDSLESIGADQYRILLTMISPHPSRDGEQARETLSASGMPLFNGEIRRLVAFQKAALEGMPVYEVKDPRAQLGWEDYVQVGKEVTGG